MTTADVTSDRERLDNKFEGTIFRLPRASSEMILATVPDLDGRPILLPFKNLDIGGDKSIPEELQKRGVSSFKEVMLDHESQAYLALALSKMPCPLAVHALDMHPRPDLSTFPNNSDKSFVGLMAPPWSGKTFFALSEKLIEDPRVVKVHDADPFGIESITNCWEDIVKDKPEGWFLQKPQQVVEGILQVYKDKRKNNEVPNVGGLTLRSIMDQWVNDCKNPDMAIINLVDLPGQGSKSAPKHAIQLMYLCLPMIDIKEAIMADPYLAENYNPDDRVPIEEKFKDRENSALIYFLHLRQQILNTHSNPNATSLLDKAVDESMLLQKTLIEDIFPEFKLMAAEK